MNLQTLACRVSSAAETAIAHPLALPAYIGARVVMARVLPEATVTLALSDFANVLLLLLAVSGSRQSAKIEREVDALAEAAPDVDHEGIRRDVG